MMDGTTSLHEPMQPESLVKLAGSGNTATVEEEWMRLLDSPELSPTALGRYQPVLAELCRVGKASEAEALAWAAIEALSARLPVMEIVGVAGTLLLGVPDSQELRNQVAGLYRSAYAQREGLDALLAESGLAGGRPVRRALRTLEVCLAVQEGDYLASRDDDGAARIEKIDRPAWRFLIQGREAFDTLGAVQLADRYRPAAFTEFRVLRQFARDQLIERLNADPAEIVIELCQQKNSSTTSEAIEDLLVPDLLSETEWKNWWTRARTALKKCSNVRIDGRSPYTITYDDVPIAHHDNLLAEFDAQRDPREQWEVVAKYLRECKAQGRSPSQPALVQCHETVSARARQAAQQGASSAGLFWMIAWRIGDLAGVVNASQGAVTFLTQADKLPAVFHAITDEALLDLACAALTQARPDDSRKELLGLLPTFPLGMCDPTVARLLEGGCPTADLAPVVQQILASPATYFDALLWLWDGPTLAELASQTASLTVLTRILGTLDECRRGDTIPKEQAKQIASRARTVLSARRYERFRECLQGIDREMAFALRTRINQLDNLGRAVREDILKLIAGAFPLREVEAVVPPWSREDVLYATQAGLTRKRQEVEQHVNVKMKENARAIGAAAERGDLSENSEYKFALEERDLLRARLAQMNSEIASARVMTPGDVPTDHVGIGSRVIFRRVEDGAPYEITFVGPWEADQAKGWVNYKAPLAQGVMGKRIGDRVTFDHSAASGTYEIVELHNALQAAGQTSPA